MISIFGDKLTDLGMKANELMIGDLVQVARDVCIKKDTIVKVRSIDGDNSFQEKGLKGCATCEPIDDRTLSGGVWVEFLEPIPLTAEILEKNGWKYNPDIKAYEWQQEAFYISIRLDEKTRIYVVNDYIFGMALGAVHELQHALRLCEIDKEIVL